jgi:ribosomal-protein-alanine N-acetyltransferase
MPPTFLAGSSNGRTLGSGPSSQGSNPCPAALRRVIEKGSLVYLRAPHASDAREFVRLARASRDLHRPWVYAPETAAQFASYLDRSRAVDERCFLVCEREDDSIAGVINLSQIARGYFQSAYLGYYAFAPAAGRGLMAEGLDLVMRHSFRRLKLHRLEANIQPDNDRSRRLVERAGFEYEGYSPRYLKIGGRWRDHERWAITRELWRGG